MTMSASLGRQITIKPRTGRSPKAPANPKEKQLKKKTMRSDKLPPMHPGKILCEEFMEPQAITQYRLAKDIHVAPIRISQIIRAKRSITADTALRLGKYFNMTPQFWLNLQDRYDLECAQDQLEKEIASIPVFKKAC